MHHQSSDSRGTEDDASSESVHVGPVTLRGSHGRGRVYGNARASAADGVRTDWPNPPSQASTQKIREIEVEAYVAVLKAFVAQSAAISWTRERLLCDLRREFRISDKLHWKVTKEFEIRQRKAQPRKLARDASFNHNQEILKPAFRKNDNGPASLLHATVTRSMNSEDSSREKVDSFERPPIPVTNGAVLGSSEPKASVVRDARGHRRIHGRPQSGRSSLAKERPSARITSPNSQSTEITPNTYNHRSIVPVFAKRSMKDLSRYREQRQKDLKKAVTLKLPVVDQFVKEAQKIDEIIDLTKLESLKANLHTLAGALSTALSELGDSSDDEDDGDQ